ncbi:sugar ABC transporter permease [Paenibacillus chitinolyticus]|uniref:ABC transporter permease subunit n=1 Tax=Paenibacillus chitinolyticus TaxID=79263 RepID=A0A410X3M0_9BACL|nr:ABC transporter permease subunit [Paenibacillus chitinolyticus]MCY9593167.1 ABC transporter permease subunit [Paenibacillus chitinolyticus]MCY9595316.1 ABC transporter permease subunit [Paenibacillus chitinolyticus]QAV21209.1 sugar ABC transporter permease [Paenibacillus chitinolyticus]
MAQVAVETSVSKEAKSPSIWKRFFKQWDIQLMVIPGIVFLLIFHYIPMYGVLTAFKDYDLFNGFFGSPWVGLKHFKMFFESPDFPRVMRNTIMISLFKLLIAFPAPIILALMLNEVRNKLFKNVVQTVTYLPHFLSWVVVAGFVTSFLSTDNGSLNIAMQKLSMIDEPINFLAIPEYFWTILISTGIWKDIGFGSIVYLAAIAGIDPALYESASIDGASRFKQIYLITLPCIFPVIIIFLILQIGSLMNAGANGGYEDILLLSANPVLREYSDVLDTFVYRTGIQNQLFSYATAVGLFKAVMSIVLLSGANLLARRTGQSLW